MIYILNLKYIRKKFGLLKCSGYNYKFFLFILKKNTYILNRFLPGVVFQTKSMNCKSNYGFLYEILHLDFGFNTFLRK